MVDRLPSTRRRTDRLHGGATAGARAARSLALTDGGGGVVYVFLRQTRPGTRMEFSGYLHSGSSEERPRLVQTQCPRCPGVPGVPVSRCNYFQFSSSPRVKTMVPLGQQRSLLRLSALRLCPMPRPSVEPLPEWQAKLSR